MSGKILNVFWERALIGQLWLGEGRQLNFQYESSWVDSPKSLPISIRLPLKKEVCDPEASTIFFSNLLPEADIRKALSERYGVSEGNDFRLLAEVGGECAGALTLLPKGESLEENGGYENLSTEELNGMIDNLPKRPLILAKDGIRLSLAGAQNKLPLFINQNKLFLPLGFNSSTHILKPPTPRFEDSTQNEAYCMTLAKKVGIPVPTATMLDVGKYKTYIVERFDRYSDKSGTIHRMHQEDFCQALGFYAAQKYENEGGPGYQQCFDLINRYSETPPADKFNLVKWTVFNLISGNSDAHGKNLSLLFDNGRIRLAPFYDLMSTCVYPDLHSKMAMKIGGKYDRDYLAARHWKIYSESAGLPFQIVKGLGIEVAAKMKKIAPAFANEFIAKWGGEKTIGSIVEFINKQSDRFLTMINEEGTSS